MSYEPTEMAQFFNERADGYEGHMRSFVSDLYDVIATPISTTNEPISILDLGCGTGLEFEAVFARAPNALITGVDVSEEMLSRLREKYQALMSQIRLIHGSFEQVLSSKDEYHYVLSVMALHHLLPSPKRKLYNKIRKSLRTGGRYVEGAYVVSKREEREFLSGYNKTTKNYELSPNRTYHIDVPCSIKTQVELLTKASFNKVRTIWKKRKAAIFVAETS
ncbi:Carboxy-S-adenosyl-L-methionine synthase [subsurface metagenome]